jgi:hypothetical protein
MTGKGPIMPRISQSGAWLAALSLSAALVATAAAAPIHRAQYEIYNDQQSAPRDEHPASDQQTVANQQTPSELQSHGRQQSDQPQANEQSPSAKQQNSEQAAPEQPNAFVSEEPIEPQDVAQAPQGKQAEQTSPEQTSEQTSEPPVSQTQQAAPSAETESGEEYEP